MKLNTLKYGLLFLALVSMLSPLMWAQKTQTLTGVVSDAACNGVHKMPNMTPEACTRACAKSSGYALVVGSDVYKVKGHEADFDKYAAQAVTVKGTVEGKTITVSSVSPAKKS